MAKDNSEENDEVEEQLEKIRQKRQDSQESSEGAGDIFSEVSGQTDPESPIDRPEPAVGTSEEQEESSDSEPSETSEDSGSESAEDVDSEKEQVSTKELLNKLSGDIEESDREILEDALEARENREEWQKNLTKKSQEVSKLEQEVQDLKQVRDFVSQLPPNQQQTFHQEFQNLLERAESGQLNAQSTDTGNLKEKVDLPEKFEEDEETKETFEQMFETFESELEARDQTINQLQNQLSSVSQQAQQEQLEPEQMDPQTQKEVTRLSGELEQLEQKFPVLDGPKGDEIVNEMIDYSTEQAQRGNDISLEGAFMALYPEMAQESLEKSAAESQLKEQAENGTVIEDTGENENKEADQSRGLKDKVREDQKNSPRVSRSELLTEIEEMWEE